ncbi:MAG: IclR family transcriptional regulator [Candidatus Acidiferrales bacterium]
MATATRKRARTPRNASLDATSETHEPRGERRYFSRGVGRALEIIELLTRNTGSLGLNDVASRINMTKSSAFRLLRTLEALDYVTQIGDGRYLILPENRATVPSRIANSLVRVARPVMKRLNMEFQETVSMAVLFTNHIEVVEVFESPMLIRMANTVGKIIPPHASSMGKSITACQNDETRNKLLRSYGFLRFTPNTITDQLALRENFEQIRKQGYSYDAEESIPEGCCFGVPLLIEPYGAIAALSLSMPKSRLPQGAGAEKMVHALIEASSHIARDLGQAVRPRS